MKRPSKPKPPNVPELQGQILSAQDTPEAHQANAEFVEWLIQVTLEEERLAEQRKVNPHDESDHAH